MAGVKWSAFTAGSALTTSNEFVGLASGVNVRWTIAQLATFLSTATLGAGTITTSQPFTLTQTWNAGGVTFTALKVNVTNSASADSSKLLDLQVGSTSKLNFSIPAANFYRLDVTNGAVEGTAFRLTGDAGGSFMLFYGTGAMGSSDPHTTGIALSNGDKPFWFASAGLASVGLDPFNRGVVFSAASINPSGDVYLVRDAAGVLAQRNGTNAQTLRVYNTYTGSDNEWATIWWDSNSLYMGATKSGSGNARQLLLLGSQVTCVTWDGGSYSRLICADFALAGGAGRLSSSASGVIRLSNSDDNDFSRLQFGGTTSSFPALRRNGAALEACLADGSNYGNFNCSTLGAHIVQVDGAAAIYAGSGSPEGVVTAAAGSLYMNTAGGTDTSLYTKGSGSGNTGWVAVDNV